ncbi:integrase [Candidatus Marinamargulisbacteria bacterium SCGC AAA071-K20]|nr:integrase [Candidatus Marinamargulisbacteria bacterium SCGC AAA071-K20]
MDFLILFVTGVFVSLINVVAGGASLISLPVLIFLGVPPLIANATNRVGIVSQNIFSVYGFHQKGINLIRFSLPLAGCGIVGAVIGARVAVDIPDHLFKSILGVVMVMIVVVMIYDPIDKIKQGDERLTGKYWIFSAITYFFIGVYAGFIQAGVGLLCITTNVLINKMDLVKANCVKVTVAFCYALTSIMVFVYYDMVWWSYGLALGAGTAVGGWFMSRYSVKKGHKWLKNMLLLVIVCMAIWLFI